MSNIHITRKRTGEGKKHSSSLITTTLPNIWEKMKYTESRINEHNNTSVVFFVWHLQSCDAFLEHIYSIRNEKKWSTLNIAITSINLSNSANLVTNLQTFKAKCDG